MTYHDLRAKYLDALERAKDDKFYLAASVAFGTAHANRYCMKHPS